MIYYIIYLGIAFLGTWLLTSLFQFVGKRYYLIPEAKKNLLVHRKNVPYLGGAALYFGLICTLLSFFLWKINNNEFEFDLSYPQLVAFLIASALVSFVGLLYDVYTIKSNWLHGLAQVVAAVLLIVAGIKSEMSYFQVLPLPLGEELSKYGQIDRKSVV